MSLNWTEIDLVLDELSLENAHIQQVVQPDFRNILFQIYQPANPFWLRICLETGRTRLHRTSAPPAKPGKRQRFAQLLHARIRGGRIVAARQLNSDRIVRIDVIRAGEPTILWTRLWGGAANLIATDQDGTIIDAFFRRPKRGEISGGRYMIAEAESGSENGDDRFASRFAAGEKGVPGSVNEQIDTYYRESAESGERERLLAAATRMLGQRRSRLEQQLEKAESRLIDVEAAERMTLYGDLIKAALHEISPGDRWLETVDYTNDNSPMSIELDPSLSAVANAEQFYRRSRTARRRGAALTEEIHNLRNQLDIVRSELASVPDADLSSLRVLVQEISPTPKRGAKSRIDTPGLRFAAEGFTILVGRNGRENDQLLRHHVRGNDLWLHTRDCPGGYVFIRAQKGKSVPLEVLLDAGNLAVHFSKARTSGRAELYYTHVKYLRRAKDGPVGRVLPTHEKNLTIVADRDRISRLLA